jgi:hypothetical protein
MFKKAMGLLCQVIQQTGDLTLLTDGEKRYGSLLFELCSQGPAQRQTRTTKEDAAQRRQSAAQE